MLFENVSFFSFKNKKETSKKWVNQTTWCVDSIGSSKLKNLGDILTRFGTEICWL